MCTSSRSCPNLPSSGRPENPWPTWPLVLRTSAAHEEGGERLYAGDDHHLPGRRRVVACAPCAVRRSSSPTGPDGRPEFRPVEGSAFELPCELVLLALGFLGAERDGVVAELGLELDARGNVAADGNWATNVDGVFVCGDMTRGQSLIVWAIAEGRSAAAAVDRFLMGDTDVAGTSHSGTSRAFADRVPGVGVRWRVTRLWPTRDGTRKRVKQMRLTLSSARPPLSTIGHSGQGRKGYRHEGHIQ